MTLITTADTDTTVPDINRMILQKLNILNFKNIEEVNLDFSPKINCFIGLNAQGKTNMFDAIYTLSFTKSAFNNIDNLNIQHGKNMAWIEGVYADEQQNELTVSCSLKTGTKKIFRVNRKICPRLLDHVGVIPLVMTGPEDVALISGGSGERRKFMDVVICQRNKHYLHRLSQYNALLKQRNALLKQYADDPTSTTHDELLSVLDEQMLPLNRTIYEDRLGFIRAFLPFFRSVYEQITRQTETVDLLYKSQLHDRDIGQALLDTRQRDKILGWTTQGIHKDDLQLLIGDPTGKLYPVDVTGSQGQQKTYITALKLAQAQFLGKPLLLLDDIFDKLDACRVNNIIQLINTDAFGQIFITDTNRLHLTQLLPRPNNRIFHVEKGQFFDQTP